MKRTTTEKREKKDTSELSVEEHTKVIKSFPFEKGDQPAKQRHQIFTDMDYTKKNRVTFYQVETELKTKFRINTVKYHIPILCAFEHSAIVQGKNENIQTEAEGLRLFFLLLQIYFQYFIVFMSVQDNQNKTNQISFEKFKQTLPSLKEWGLKVQDDNLTFNEWDEENTGQLSYQNFIKHAAMVIIPQYFPEYQNFSLKRHFPSLQEQCETLCEKLKSVRRVLDLLVNDEVNMNMDFENSTNLLVSQNINFEVDNYNSDIDNIDLEEVKSQSSQRSNKSPKSAKDENLVEVDKLVDQTPKNKKSKDVVYPLDHKQSISKPGTSVGKDRESVNRGSMKSPKQNDTKSRTKSAVVDDIPQSVKPRGTIKPGTDVNDPIAKKEALKHKQEAQLKKFKEAISDYEGSMNDEGKLRILINNLKGKGTNVALDLQRAQLERQMAEQKAAQQEILAKQLEASLKEKNEQIKRLEGQVDQLIKNSEIQLVQHDATIKQLDIMTKNNENNAQLLNQINQEKADLQAKFDDFVKKSEEKEKLLQDEITSLKAQLEQLLQNNDQNTKLLEEMNLQKADLQKAFDEAHLESQKREDQLVADKEKLKQELEQLLNDNNKNTQLLKDLNQEKLELQQKLDESNKKYIDDLAQLREKNKSLMSNNIEVIVHKENIATHCIEIRNDDGFSPRLKELPEYKEKKAIKAENDIEKKEEVVFKQFDQIINSTKRSSRTELKMLAQNNALVELAKTKIYEKDKLKLQNFTEAQKQEVAWLTSFAVAENFQQMVDKVGIKASTLTFTLIWDKLIDLDIQLKCPCGFTIDYNRHKECTTCGGKLDKDTDCGNRDETSVAVENIYFENPKKGEYTLSVKYFSGEEANVVYSVVVHENKNVTRLIPDALTESGDAWEHIHIHE